MEGFSLIRTLREILNEVIGSSFMNDRTSYDYLYHAVQDFNVRTHFITGNQTINVVSGTSEYALNPDYGGLALIDTYNRPYIKHTYNGTDTFIYSTDYSSIVLNNDTSTADVATQFAITDADQPDQITGTATSDGATLSGECTLTDSTAPFASVESGQKREKFRRNAVGKKYADRRLPWLHLP